MYVCIVMIQFTRVYNIILDKNAIFTRGTDVVVND